MEGKIVSYNSTTNTGSIQSSDGSRYVFFGSDYHSQTQIEIGQVVNFDFDTNLNRIVTIYPIQENDRAYANNSLGLNTFSETANNSSYNPSPSRQVSSQQVIENSKEAVSDTLKVLQSLQKDPTHGLQATLASLGDDRAFNTGIFLCLLFVISCWAAIVKFVSLLIVAFSSFGSILSGGFSRNFNFELGFSEHIRILVTSSIPALGTIFIFWVIAHFFKGQGNYKQFTFAAGICLFPLTVFLFALWLIGSSSVTFLSLLGVFCLTTLVLLLNATTIEILRLPSRSAFFLVPTILVINSFILRIAFEILY
jgi:hypothetical protein